MDAKAHGDHLAITATLRKLASHIALLARPDAPNDWFIALGQETFDYVDNASNPELSQTALREIKEAAYDTLRMIFDPKGFEG